jgi:hypothetical protein
MKEKYLSEFDSCLSFISFLLNFRNCDIRKKINLLELKVFSKALYLVFVTFVYFLQMRHTH